MADAKRRRCTPLVTAALLKEDLPLSDAANAVNQQALADIRAVMEGSDDRLIVITGPCSVHDVDSAKDYANKLAALKVKHANELIIVMRVYFEKPRTTVGWKGLINDPDLDGSFHVNKGLRTARELLLHINVLGVPAATEFLDLITPQYISDLICWGAIGARTTESQGHREMVSGLPAAIGFKNGTSGDVQIAIDACGASMRGHSYLGVSENGVSSVMHSEGNDLCHVVLRGGADGPNFEAKHIGVTVAKMTKGKLRPNIVIDCSHGNSLKKHENQPGVCENIGEQVAGGDQNIVGVMIESNLVEGAQKVVPGTKLTYGQSITDACVNFDTNETMLAGLAAAVQKRRATSSVGN